MTAVAAERASTRSLALAWARRRWALLAAGGLWTLFVLNFNAISVHTGDERVQYGFVQRLYGDAPHASGYGFGLGLLEAPFYGIGKLLELLGLKQVGGFGLPAGQGYPTREAATALGLGLLTLAAFPLLVPVIRGLRLRFAPGAILAAIFGTPFFYYATFVPTKSHAYDALLVSAAMLLAYRYFADDAPAAWLPFALGAVLGVAVTVRTFDGAAGVALVACLLWLRRYRHAAELTATAVVVALLLFAVPWALGVSVFGDAPPGEVVTFAPLNPLRMLFTDHRGYFVWSPVALLGAIGFARLLVRRPEQRRFLVAAATMGVAIVASYALIGFWDGTWAFGQRYYTPLFPLVAIGLAGLLDAAPLVVAPLAAAACAFSVFLALNLVVTPSPAYVGNVPGGVEDLAVLPAQEHTGLGAYLWGVRIRSHLLNLFR